MHKKEVSAEVPDWSREKKTKFSFQGGENRLMRLKAQRAPVTGGRVGK